MRSALLLVTFLAVITSTSCTSMQVTKSDMLPNEYVITSKPANAIIRLDEYGLSKFCFDKYNWILGMQNKEAIGGTLYLTNYRLIFKSHSMNRVVGNLSIYLPTIESIRDTSVLVKKMITIDTIIQSYDFVIWGIPEYINIVNETKNNLSESDTIILKKTLLSQYSSTMKVNHNIESINQDLNFYNKLLSTINSSSDISTISTVLNIIDLLK